MPRRLRRPEGKDSIVALHRYLDLIVEPTIEDFARNPYSLRHAFLACVVAYHAIDRLAEKPPNLRREWNKESVDFALVDLVAHTFKHVEVGRSPKADTIPLRTAVLAEMGLNTHALNESGIDTRNLLFAVRDAVKFIRM